MTETVRYVGDPFVDAGVAVLEHWLEKPCKEFTAADLESAGERLKSEYAKKIWKGYLTTHLPNSVWCNFNPRITPARRAEMLTEVLSGYTRTPVFPAAPCCYCSRPSQVIADRSRAPLITSKKSMSIGVGGRPGTPVCGYCLCALQFYPQATLKVIFQGQGRSLFWFAPEPRWTFLLVGQFLTIVESVTAGSTDKLESLKWPSTLLLKAAQDVLDEWLLASAEQRPSLCDIVGCLSTNFGTEPDFEELRIPKAMLEFWAEAGSFGPTYRQIVNQAWGEGKKSKSSSAAWNRSNAFYEALGRAFREPNFAQGAKSVAAKFFLKPHLAAPPPHLFGLTIFFLEKVAGMERARLEAIRKIADQIAENISEKKIERDFFSYSMSLGQLLNYFARLQKRLAEAGTPLNWDQLLLALGISNVDDRTARDYWMVQDLMLIRIYERLGKTVGEMELPSLQPLATDPMAEALEDFKENLV